MVWPQFQNLDLECWVHKRGLGRKPWSLCLHHGSKEAGRELLTALDELRELAQPAQRTLLLKPSTRPRARTTLRLRLVLNRPEFRVLRFSYDERAALFEMTTAGWPLLRSAIEIWLRGGEDYGLHARHSKRRKIDLGAEDLASGELWFWGPFYYAP